MRPFAQSNGALPVEELRRNVASRVTATNASRAQFLGGIFAVMFAFSLVGDAFAMGTLRRHAFMFAQLASSLAVVVGVRWTSFGRRYADLVFGVGLSAVSGFGAIHLSQFGGLDGPYFYGVYAAPPVLIPILMPLRRRLLTTGLALGSFVACYWVCRPDLFAHPMAHVPITYLLAIGAIAVFTGRHVQRLEEASFVTLAELEGSTATLNERLLVLEKQPERVRVEVARQLHDDIAQLVSGARLRLDGWSRRRGADDGFASVTELLDQLAGRVRGVIAELREPPAVGALTSELANLRETYGADGLRVDIVYEPDPLPALDTAHVAALAAIAREALTNAVRHGHANEATISLTMTPESVTLEVWDDGHGRVADVAEGYGLLGVRERAAELGGEMRLSDYEHGLRLSVRLPHGQAA